VTKQEPLQFLYFSSITCKMGAMKQYETSYINSSILIH